MYIYIMCIYIYIYVYIHTHTFIIIDVCSLSKVDSYLVLICHTLPLKKCEAVSTGSNFGMISIYLQETPAKATLTKSGPLDS